MTSRIYSLLIRCDDNRLVRLDSYGVSSETVAVEDVDAEAMEQLSERLLAAAKLRRLEKKSAA